MEVKRKLNGMEQFGFNNLLFSNLSDVLDISGAEIARRCDLKQQVLNRYQNGGSVLPVQVLIKLCNSLRMPARYFVSTDGSHILPSREEATIQKDYWHPIWWDRKAAELTFGDGEGKIYWKDLAEVMDVSSQKPHEWFALKKRFPIDRFFKACNHYGISPLRFLVDDNTDTGQRKREPHRSSNRSDGLRDDIQALSRQLGDLTATIDDLKNKYKELLNAHKQLAQRVQVNIDTISGGYIGNIGVAADPLSPNADD